MRSLRLSAQRGSGVGYSEDRRLGTYCPGYCPGHTLPLGPLDLLALLKSFVETPATKLGGDHTYARAGKT